MRIKKDSEHCYIIAAHHWIKWHSSFKVILVIVWIELSAYYVFSLHIASFKKHVAYYDGSLLLTSIWIIGTISHSNIIFEMKIRLKFTFQIDIWNEIDLYFLLVY